MRSTESAGLPRSGTSTGLRLFDRQRRPAEPVVEQADPGVHAPAPFNVKPQLDAQARNAFIRWAIVVEARNLQVSDRYGCTSDLPRFLGSCVLMNTLAGSRDAPVKVIVPIVSVGEDDQRHLHFGRRGRHGQQPSDEAIAKCISLTWFPRRAAAKSKSPILASMSRCGCPAPTRPVARPWPHRGRRCARQHIDRVQHRIRPGRPPLNTHHAALRSPHSGWERASPRSRDGRQTAKLGKRRIDQPVVGADNHRDAGIRKAVGQATEHRVDARERRRALPTGTGIVRQAVEAGIVGVLGAPRPQPSAAAIVASSSSVARSRAPLHHDYGADCRLNRSAMRA